MRYIIKNNKVYGIYNQNYSSLTGKPQINNHELAEGISYSSEDLGIVVGPISQEEYDNMPTHNPQTIYVVYNDVIDPSSNTINYNDLDNKPQINGQTLTGNKSLSSLNIYSKEEVRNLIAAGRSILVVPTKPANPTPNTLYYVETSTPAVYHVYLYDSNTQEADLGLSTVDLSDYYTKTQSDNKFEILTNKVDNVNFTTPSTTQYLSEKGTVNNFAPISIVNNFLPGLEGTSGNDCVFNISANYSITRNNLGYYCGVFKQLFVGKINEPISGGEIFGNLETVEYIVQQLDMRVTFEQTFTRMQGTNQTSVWKFYRKGQLDVSGQSFNVYTDITTSKNSIVWQPWYPLEYPSISMPLNPTSVSNYGLTAWGGNANITGGILKITYNGLMCTSVATNIKVTSLTRFRLKQDYAIGHLSGIDNNKNCYLWGGATDLVVNQMEANIRYYGQIMIPLGY